MRRFGVPTMVLVILAAACGQGDDGSSMDTIAEEYVRLVLEVGQLDGDYVDYYYGPEEWRPTGEAADPAELAERADSLAGMVDALDLSSADEMVQLRQSYLRAQLLSVAARARMLAGESYTFDDESRALYNAVAPTQPESVFDSILASLESALPGSGSLSERYEQFRSDFVIPPALLDTVFRTAVEACKARTARHLELPQGEDFVIEYVTDKSWSGYNWYQGGYRSLIQVNTDFPIYIDRAIDLACHEGYPGHHYYNLMLEHHLVNGRGWREFTVYALFSPQSLIAEGSANYGIEVAFPGNERIAFERDSLFPLAGLDPARVDEYYRIQSLVEGLGYAGNEAARGYLDGQISADSAAAWLVRYAMFEPDRARQRVRFMDQYRSYVINYNLGKDLVAQYVERDPAAQTEAGRWERFSQLLASPRLPLDLN